MIQITPLRVVPAMLSRQIQLGVISPAGITPLPLSQLDDPEQVDAELGHP